MIITLRRKTKSFADLNSQAQQQDPDKQLTPAQLASENWRMQREIMKNNRMRQKMQADELKASRARIAQAQKGEDTKDTKEDQNNIKVKKMEQERDEAKNIGLYKTKSKMPAPVPMKS